VFDSIYYVLKPEVRRRKLDQKADIGVLIGYSTTSKAYKIYDLNFNKVVVARDVKVVENAIWDWKNSSGEGSKQMQQDELDAAKIKTKLNADGKINKHKARLVVKGYSQEAGIDFTETFAPVSRHETMKLLLALAAQNGWYIFQLDVKSAFLNGVLNEEIYVEQPAGLEKSNSINKVYLLKKVLYGLKQAPRAWYSMLDNHLLSLGFNRSMNEVTLYVKHADGHKLIVPVYVNDLLITWDKEQLVEEFKTNMKDMFEMNELGLLIYFLGIEVTQSDQGYFLCQKRFSLKILDNFAMSKSKPVSTPMIQGQKLADIFTKPLAKNRFEDLRARIGMCSFGTKEEC
jgi:hypothetical protein